MGLAAIRVTNIDTALVPTATNDSTSVTDQSTTVDDTAADLIGTALNDITTHVFWTLDGANARFTFDGSDPTTSNGHFVADGKSGIWDRRMAEACKVIRDGSVDGYIHITEMTK